MAGLLHENIAFPSLFEKSFYYLKTTVSLKKHPDFSVTKIVPGPVGNSSVK